MRRPLVVTGPPAAGKTTTARALALSRARAAYLDVDDIRLLVVAGHRAPWDGAEGRAQQLLGVRHACLLARSLLGAGFEVSLSDVLDPGTAVLYRELLPGCLLVRLTLPLAAVRARSAGRHEYLTGDEVESLWRADAADPPPVDHTLDVAGLDPDAQLAAVERLWTTG